MGVAQSCGYFRGVIGCVLVKSVMNVAGHAATCVHATSSCVAADVAGGTTWSMLGDCRMML